MSTDSPVPPTGALEAKAVNKRFFDGSERRLAVVDATLSLSPGSFTALVGPSGCGKTTLLKLLGGLLPPTSGDIWVDGQSIAHMRDHHRVAYCRSRIGFVLQSLGLIDGMSVIENVLLPLVPIGGATGEDRDHADSLLERFGVLPLKQREVRSLSGGQRQRVAIVRALIQKPTVLLLDEPSAHIDAENTEIVMAFLAEQQSLGQAILATTHDPRLHEDSRFDQVLKMSEGKLLAP